MNKKGNDDRNFIVIENPNLIELESYNLNDELLASKTSITTALSLKTTDHKLIVDYFFDELWTFLNIRPTACSTSQPAGVANNNVFKLGISKPSEAIP